MIKWDVYMADLEPVVGSEQGKVRPVIIISENAFNRIRRVLNIIPLTSLKEGRKVYRNEVFISASEAGLTKDSIALIHQIRTVDKQRLGRRIGVLAQQPLRDAIFKAIRMQFGM